LYFDAVLHAACHNSVVLRAAGLELDLSEAPPQAMQQQAKAVSAGSSSRATAAAALVAVAAAMLAV
jgi:hypothetical protein